MAVTHQHINSVFMEWVIIEMPVAVDLGVQLLSAVSNRQQCKVKISSMKQRAAFNLMKCLILNPRAGLQLPLYLPLYSLSSCSLALAVQMLPARLPAIKLLLPFLWPAESALFRPFIPITFLNVSLPLISQEKNLEWFPRMRAMSLVSSEGDNEQNEIRSLQEKLDNTVTLVAQLSGQLAELKEQVQRHFREFFMLRWKNHYFKHCNRLN